VEGIILWNFDFRMQIYWVDDDKREEDETVIFFERDEMRWWWLGRNEKNDCLSLLFMRGCAKAEVILAVHFSEEGIWSLDWWSMAVREYWTAEKKRRARNEFFVLINQCFFNVYMNYSLAKESINKRTSQKKRRTKSSFIISFTVANSEQVVTLVIKMQYFEVLCH
jgi:hypothetical protein